LFPLFVGVPAVGCPEWRVGRYWEVMPGIPTTTLRAFALALALAAASSSHAVAAARLVEARLIAESRAAAPGSETWIALHLSLPDGWHVYWKNPGDSGTPPRLDWRLPAGVEAGEIAWPAPSRFAMGPLANFGYEGEVVLPVPVRVSPAAGPGESLALRGTAHWLVCKEECIPESQEVALDLPIAAGVAEDAADADRVRAALAAVPAELPGWTAAIAAQDAATLTLRAELAPGAEAQRRQWFFYPATGGIIEPAEDQPAVIDENAVTLRLTKSAMLEDPVTDLRGVLVGRSRDAGTWRLRLLRRRRPSAARRGQPSSWRSPGVFCST